MLVAGSLVAAFVRTRCNVLKKIFPAGAGNAPYNSFKLIVVAEGYLANEQAKFVGDCVDLIEALLDITPFNLTRAHPHWLSGYSSFALSQNSGPAINQAAAAGRTRFDSSFTTATGALTLSQVKVNAFVAAETINVDGTAVSLSQICAQGSATHGKNGTLIVFLLPPVTGQVNGGEAEATPAPADYHFLATSKDARYQQIVARGIASCLGLGGEYELAGPERQAPASAADLVSQPYNLAYFDPGPPNPVNGTVKWYRLLSAVQRIAPPSVHGKADPATPDMTLDAVPATPPDIEFWEGGGGYRTKIWRTAHDCLMRRRIGIAALPVRSAEVPFCRACRHYLTNVMA